MQLIRVYCGSWLLCLISVLSISILFSLGLWQLGRAQEKESLLAFAKSNSGQELENLSSILDKGQPIENFRYRGIKLSGFYKSDKQFLLDNQVKNRRVGYNVITPFKTIEGAIVLIDRGWVPLGLSRTLKPDVSLSNEDVQRNIEGTLYSPLGEAYSLGSMDEGEIMWPRVIQYLDFNEMSERLGQEVKPFVVRLSPHSDDGFLREWPVVAAGPEKHLGYAFQWFTMAFVLASLLVVLSVKRLKNYDDTGGK